MNNFRIKNSAVAILLLVGVKFYAQKNVITPLSPFLNTVIDARSGGMGDVGAATSADGNALFHNAAKMVFHKREINFGINYTPWLRELIGDIDIANLTYQQKIDDRSAFGAGFKYFSYGSVSTSQNDGSDGGTINPYELSIDGAYSLKLSDNYSMSVALRYIRTDLRLTGTGLGEQESRNAFAVDISGYYVSNEMAFSTFNGVARAGFNISNIGPKVKLISNEGYLPTNLKLGGGFDFIIDDFNQVGLTLEFNKLLVPTIDKGQNFLTGMIDSFNDAPGGSKEELQEITIGFGAEYLYNQSFAFRAGYHKEHEDKGSRNFLTFGAGFKASSFNIDVSYLSSISSINNPLANTLRFSISFDLGDVYEL